MDAMPETYSLTHEWITGDMPCLSVTRDGLPADAPLVLALHGLGSRKEKMLQALYEFARRGFRAVAPDVRLHGEWPEAGEREGRMQTDYLAAMAAMIEETTRDLSRLLDYFAPIRAAIHGISLGGYITFAALLAEPRLCAAAVALGSPDWLGPLRGWGLGPGDLAYDRVAAINPLDLAPYVIPPRPLLMLHGALDEVVSVDGVTALEERLRPLYAAHPERLRLHVYPELGHHYTDDMLERSVDWLERFTL